VREHARERARMSKRGTEKRRRGRTAPAQQRQRWGLHHNSGSNGDFVGVDWGAGATPQARPRIDTVDVPARLWSAEGRRWRAPTIAGTVRRRGGWRRAVGCGSSRQDFPPLAPAYGCVSRRWRHFFFPSP
jgi:hypothetical protein